MTSQPQRHLAALARAAELCRRHDSGETIQAIADSIGVTRQRASAILKYGRLARDMALNKAAADTAEQMLSSGGLQPVNIGHLLQPED